LIIARPSLLGPLADQHRKTRAITQRIDSTAIPRFVLLPLRPLSVSRQEMFASQTDRSARGPGGQRHREKSQLSQLGNSLATLAARIMPATSACAGPRQTICMARDATRMTRAASYVAACRDRDAQPNWSLKENCDDDD
jgi:hypothetical protein